MSDGELTRIVVEACHAAVVVAAWISICKWVIPSAISGFVNYMLGKDIYDEIQKQTARDAATRAREF